jgi:pyridoxine 4-dehydrogenase
VTDFLDAPRTITAAAAGTWTLGDLTVNRIGFGAMRLTVNPDGTPSDRDRAIAVLRRAVELGVNHIDTAAFYFSALRSANELINRALAPYPDDLVITTKVGPGRDASGDWFPATPQQLRGQVEENLRQLGRDHLDVVNLRNMNRVWTDSIAEHFGALAELRDAGLIRHLGVSSVSREHLAQAQTIAPAHDEAVLEVARAHGGTAPQVKLAWTLQRGPHVLAIPGTGNPDHLVANLAAGALRLSADELTRLESVG